MGENEREMDRMVAALENAVLDVAVDAMRLIHRGTVEPYGSSPGTPVDTGQHRSAGRFGLNSPPSFVPADDPPFVPMPEKEAEVTFASAQLGDDLFWGSNAPVPALLEDGLSPKAPDGFLELSVEQAAREVEAMEVSLK